MEKIATILSVKKLSVLCLTVLGAVAATGCSTPAYSAKERGQQIARNWDDAEQGVEADFGAQDRQVDGGIH